MRIAFEKYQGTGNDFILIDEREEIFPGNIELVKQLCRRKTGIGSDGLMLIRHSAEADFEMVFYNPDGSESLCGNGSRCAVDFAIALGMTDTSGRFITTDGLHDFRVEKDGEISIGMRDVAKYEEYEDHLFLNTGSPHLIVRQEDIGETDVLTEGRNYRFAERFSPGGVNVNFVSLSDPGHFRVRTYERGVENETLSCGTGVTAVALAMNVWGHAEDEAIIHTPGGTLKVSFQKNGNNFENIRLKGPVKKVFSGHIDA